MPFIGPKPVIPNTPEYCTPFEAVGRLVKDADGREAFTVDGPSSFERDGKFAVEIADALNAKYAPATIAAEPTPALRTFVTCRLDGNFIGDQFVYEVAPDRFSWGNSRRDAETRGYTWAFPNTSYTFRDVETGEDIDQVTGKPVDA